MSRLLLYKVLTQCILLLARLRERVMDEPRLEIRRDRVFDVYQADSFQCCDCGLRHVADYFGPGTDCGHRPAYDWMSIVGHMWPVRPKGYDYGWRRGAGTADLALPKDGAP